LAGRLVGVSGPSRLAFAAPGLDALALRVP
jgi:hypothetical protein